MSKPEDWITFRVPPEMLKLAAAQEAADRERAGVDPGLWLTEEEWNELDPDERWKRIEPKIKQRAKKIDPETYVTFRVHALDFDPYDVGWDLDEEMRWVGRASWVNNPELDGPAILLDDFLEEHPELKKHYEEEARKRDEETRKKYPDLPF